jgi:hypothetical protein
MNERDPSACWSLWTGTSCPRRNRCVERLLCLSLLGVKRAVSSATHCSSDFPVFQFAWLQNVPVWRLRPCFFLIGGLCSLLMIDSLVSSVSHASCLVVWYSSTGLRTQISAGFFIHACTG